MTEGFDIQSSLGATRTTFDSPEDSLASPPPFSTAGSAALYAARCRRTLDEALDSTPAYEDWRVFDPGRDKDVFSRLAALPALTKHRIRVHGPEGFVPRQRRAGFAAALSSGEIEIVPTSGSTGDRVMNVWHQPWWDASEAASWQLNAHARAARVGEHREAILTSPWCAGFPCEDGYLTMEQRTQGRFLYLCERSDPSGWPRDLMDRMAREIDVFRPVVLEANPSFLAKLSRHIVENRLRVHSPDLVILTYEFPSVLHYRQIARAFDAPIASSYGSTEAGYVFMECEAGRLHQVTASCHVDFLPFAPADGGPDLGRILVSAFDNPWRSLLRFDVGDVARLDGHTPCPCGRREGLTLASVEGRAVNLTRTPEGRAVTQGRVDRALGVVDGLAEYQVVQTGRSSYRARFAVEGGADPLRVAGSVRKALRAVYGPEASIAPEPVESVAPDPPGKYRLAKSLEPIDADSFLDPRSAPPKF